MEKINKKMIEDDYIKKFWVGLLDGEGNIQVNQRKKKELKYRMVIKLKATLENIKMFEKIQQVIGGYVREEEIKKKEKKFVIWEVNTQKEVERLMDIFNKYPLVTFRKKYQLEFLKENMKRKDVSWYLKNRDNKYKIYINKIKEIKIEEIVYFEEWFSGFVEATGCFCIRKNMNHSFKIKQQYEEKVIEKIKKYFELTTKIKEQKNEMYQIEIYKKITLNQLIMLLNKNPLLGEKKNLFEEFKKQIEN